MKVRLRPGLLAVLLISLLGINPLLTTVVAAATFTVVSTGNGDDVAPGNGVCADASGICTLQAAIREANFFAGSDTINFNIPAADPGCAVSGVCTIQPSVFLPPATDPVFIDGYTQPGATVNTNPPGSGSNAVLTIELNGTNAGGGGTGLSIRAAGSGSTVRGLAINGFSNVGILLEANAANNVIEGNFIGTDITGTAPLGNTGSGVFISSGPNNTVGGATAAARNVISANATGIHISGSAATGNMVQGNLIGTDVTGTVPLGNTAIGVRITQGASNNTIGGTTAATRNVISANRIRGVDIDGAQGNMVQGNFIGTDVTGTVTDPDTVPGNGDELGNDGAGVRIFNSPNNTIGGTAPGAGNVISGNTGPGGVGVEIQTGLSTGNMVQGNFIGTDVTGMINLGNDFSGVFIGNFASGNTIGGTASGAGNTIAFSKSVITSAGDGVFVITGTRNAILSNSIFSNGNAFTIDLGIELGTNGVNINDLGDADAGANNLQNFPVLSSATSGGLTTTIEGTLNSTANTAFRLEFFANTASAGAREGESFIGFDDVTTDASGNVTFTAILTGTVPAGQDITATATDPDNNTSEFSAFTTVVASVRVVEVFAVDASTDSLHKIDLGTGTMTLIGRLGGTDMTRFTTPVSMAVRPADGVIFVNNNSPASDNGLATVDPTTGLATLVNPGSPPGGDYIDGAIAFDDLGILYAADSAGVLAIIDQNTGLANSLGGPMLPTLFGLDFNPADDLLYGLDGASPPNLLVIRPADGELLNTIPLSPNPPGGVGGTLLFDSNGTLHGTTLTSHLFEIDPSNGSVSNIRATSAFSPQGMGLIIGTVEVRVEVPADDNVEIDPGFITAIAETVVQAGAIDFEFCVAIVDDRVGTRFIPLAAYSFTGTCGPLPHNVLLPRDFEPYLANDGQLKLGIVIADSTVLFEGLITEVQDLASVLGFTPGCSEGPRSLGLSELDVASPALKLQSSDCNRLRSARFTYSTTVFPLKFTGNGESLALARVAKIKAELGQANCIADAVRRQLKQKVKQIKRDILKGEFLDAQDKFIDFAVIAQESFAAFVSCPVERNFRGLFKADGITGAFIVSEEIRDETFIIPGVIILPGAP